MYGIVIVGGGGKGVFSEESYASEIINLKDMQLIGVVEKNIAKTKAISKLLSVRTSSNINEMLEVKEKIDLVIIAVTASDHYTVFKDIVDCGFRNIILEKPVSKRLSDGIQMLKMAKKFKLNVLVNYSRRYYAEYQDIKSLIQNNTLGSYVFGNGIYGKGLFNNGSHMIDIIMWLLEVDVKAVKAYEKEKDILDDDENISAEIILTNDHSFDLDFINSTIVTEFRFTLYFENGKIDFDDFGKKIIIYEKVPLHKSSEYEVYRKARVVVVESSAIRNLLHMSEKARYDKSNQYSSLDRSVRVLEICEQIRKSLK